MTTTVFRFLTRARDEVLQRRYGAKPGKCRRIVALWPRDAGGLLMVLQGHASRHRTRDGLLYNRRVRLVRRFYLSAFNRRA